MTAEPSASPPGVGDPGDAGTAEAPAGLGPHTAVLLVSGFVSVVLAAVTMLLPVPYAELRPGPALNTLGSPGGKPLISVTGHETYPTTGSLDLTTVTVAGGPGSRLTLFDVLRGWLSSSDAVLPEQVVFPPGQTEQQSRQENRQEMASSQEAATAAAMGVLGIHVPTVMTIASVEESAPAASTLKPEDVILKVGGATVDDLDSLRGALQKVTPGGVVPVRVRRAGKERTVSVTTLRSGDGRTVLGVFIDPTFRFPFTVKIQIDDIGGPSAGMMFALGIVDVLTPGSLTGGKQIAGTGTIDSDGFIGPIGGIRQKMVGAREAGARWFLAPSDDCSEVVGHVPDGLRVVGVSSLEQALSAVRAIASGSGTEQLPTCTR